MLLSACSGDIKTDSSFSTYNTSNNTSTSVISGSVNDTSTGITSNSSSDSSTNTSSSSSGSTKKDNPFVNTTVGAEILAVASYIDEVPYLDTSSQNSNARPLALPVNYDGIPQDSDGYYDITSPTSRYYDNPEFKYAKSIYESFDSTLNKAKSLKTSAISNCSTFNKWSDRKNWLIAYDFNSSEVSFYKTTWSVINIGTPEQSTVVGGLSKANVHKDENDKINFYYVEADINYKIDPTKNNPISYELSIKYKEDDFYVYSYCLRYVNDTRYSPDFGAHIYEANTVYVEVLRTFCVDFANDGALYEFEETNCYSLEGELLVNSISKRIYDIENRLAVMYEPSSAPRFELYDESGHIVAYITQYQKFLNLYDFTGWDYFLSSSLDSDDTEYSYKFRLTNDNVNGASLSYGVRLNSSLTATEKFFVGYPYLDFSSSSYEDFSSYLDSIGFEYVGDANDLNFIKKYYDDDLHYELYGHSIIDLTDDETRSLLYEKWDPYTYSEIEEIIDYQGEAIDPSSNILDYLFEFNNGVSFDSEALLLSDLDISVKDTPFLAEEEEYHYSIELIAESNEISKVLYEGSFIYEKDEKLTFEDVNFKDIESVLDVDAYYFALVYRGNRYFLNSEINGKITRVIRHTHDLVVDLQDVTQSTFKQTNCVGEINVAKNDPLCLIVKIEEIEIDKSEVTCAKIDDEHYSLSYECGICEDTIISNVEVAAQEPEPGSSEEAAQESESGFSEEASQEPEPSSSEETV